MKPVLFALAIIGLSSAVVYLSRENMGLRRARDSAVAAALTSSEACILPSVSGTTIAGTDFSLTFPRERPVVILATKRSCPYCRSAFKYWVLLVREFPLISSVVYDGTHSYSEAELSRLGIDLRAVLTSPVTVPPYDELLASTPTVVLVGRSGRVLGKWSGELSAKRIAEIRTAFATLLL